MYQIATLLMLLIRVKHPHDPHEIAIVSYVSSFSPLIKRILKPYENGKTNCHINKNTKQLHLGKRKYQCIFKVRSKSLI